MSTKIDWADEVWNPVTGCTKVSAGCEHCYAERMSKRMGGRFGYPADAPFRVTMHEERLDEPLLWKWREPRRVFVCSMGDLFHEDVHRDFLLQVWNRMMVTPQHTFMVLTKRPERMRYLLSDWMPYAYQLAYGGYQPLQNLWLGVSAENQATANERIPWLLKTPAAVRFVSCEPLLGPVDLSAWLPGEDRKGIDWVIAGCESGPGARPTVKEWFRSLAHQTGAANVPFFLKQMVVGEKIVKMPRLDGVLWDEFPNRCEHQGCRRMDAQEYLLRGEDEDIISNLCAEHARAEGYCLSCHEWFTEETWETGICRECTEQINGGEEDYDPDAEYPYDWDDPVVPPDDGRLLPDSIVEQGPAEE